MGRAVRIRQWHCIAAAMLSCAGGTPARTHVMILAGQSNMLGLARWTGEGFPDSFPNVAIWAESDGRVRSWSGLGPGTGATPESFGPEMGLARELVRAMPLDTFRFIKVAYGGTSLGRDWTPPSQPGGPGWMYSALFRNLQLAYELHETPLPAPEALFWMQGEADALDSLWGWHLTYERNFRSFIQDVRSALGNDALPWVAGLIDIQPIWKHVETIRAAQLVVDSEDNRGCTIETVGLPTDGIHYTTDGESEIGRRMGLQWLDLSGVEPHPGMLHGVVSTTSRSRVDQAIVRSRRVSIDGRKGPWLDKDEARRSVRPVSLLLVELEGHDGETWLERSGAFAR